MDVTQNPDLWPHFELSTEREEPFHKSYSSNGRASDNSIDHLLNGRPLSLSAFFIPLEMNCIFPFEKRILHSPHQFTCTFTFSKYATRFRYEIWRDSRAINAKLKIVPGHFTAGTINQDSNYTLELAGCRFVVQNSQTNNFHSATKMVWQAIYGDCSGYSCTFYLLHSLLLSFYPLLKLNESVWVACAPFKCIVTLQLSILLLFIISFSNSRPLSLLWPISKWPI